MKFHRIIILLAAVAAVFPAAAQTRLPLERHTVRQQTRRQLQQHYLDLLDAYEAIRQELEDMKATRNASDSIAGEMIEIYEENEDRIGAGLRPEDYTPEVTDSLLNLWYRSRARNGRIDGNLIPYDMDSVRLTSNVPDSVLIRRLAAMNPYISLPYNETVKNYIVLYSEKMPSKMARMLALADYYMPIFEETLNRYDMPLELKYMAVIESALNPTAVSRAGAKGMWQFMYSTARNYGLKINSWIDERLDPVKSADAAARYMQDAYRIFGDWNLAISAYNCGSGNVNKAIRRAGGNSDFWSIYEYLPRETRGYVPAFVGAMYAFRYHKEYGIEPEELALPVHVDTFDIRRNLHFTQISEIVGVPADLLRDMNPQYIHDVIPGSETPCILRLPSQYTAAFIDRQDTVYTHRAKDLFSPATLENMKNAGSSSGQIVYRVKKGDYLGKIAAAHHVSVAQIKQWNNLRNNNLRIGQRLIIYKGGGPAPAKPTSAPGKAASGSSASGSSGTAASGNSAAAASGANSGAASDGQGHTVYTVRKGDTLSKIASRYPGVSANDIMTYNGIGSNIKPGQKIKIPNR